MACGAASHRRREAGLHNRGPPWPSGAPAAQPADLDSARAASRRADWASRGHRYRRLCISPVRPQQITEPLLRAPRRPRCDGWGWQTPPAHSRQSPVRAGKQGAVMFQPRAAELTLPDVQNALVHGAVGNYAEEAAVLLSINFGHWLPQLQSADLITLAPDVDSDRLWAQIGWPDLQLALSAGLLFGSSGEVRVLRAAASIAEGLPVDLGDLAA